MAREAPDPVGRLPDRPAGNSGHPLNLEPPVYDPYGLDSALETANRQPPS
jgi:hypothetical protein